MTTLRVTVDDEQVEALRHLLLTVPFIKNIQEEENDHVDANSSLSVLNRIKAIIASAGGKNLFAEIEDPVEWQRQLRKGWERDI